MNQKHGPFPSNGRLFYLSFYLNWQSSDNQLQNPLQACKSASQFVLCYDSYLTDQNRLFGKILGLPIKFSSNNESIFLCQQVKLLFWVRSLYCISKLNLSDFNSSFQIVLLYVTLKSSDFLTSKFTSFVISAASVSFELNQLSSLSFLS